ncbi:peptidoglycan DD-metalloendopeptidase family protein [Candidatus Kaiserbacteria bacterium]|nr:peptidoglycan DD-metalloendopeptidase family protein [Candidatus Kaiserbacteria bacterium]
MTRIAALVFAVALLFVAPVFADDDEAAKQLQAQISDHQQKIKDLEQEIATYEKQLTDVGNEKRTLQSAVQELDISRKKVGVSIQVEEQKIDALEEQIAQLDGNIATKEQTIASLKRSLGNLLANMDAIEGQTLIEAFLNADSLETAWDEIGTVEQVNAAMQDRVGSLRTERDSLTQTRKASDEKRVERVGHQNALVAQKRSLDITKKEKNTLLSSTNAKESSYQKLLEDKRAAKIAFESQLQELESELEYTLDPTRIPAAGKGVLRWPLDNVLLTQKFGDTDFARSGAYNGNGHNGIDFRASVGTPLKAALSGIVIGTGNTDIYRGCYSYGKWVMIKHANGLSTLYAHLSEISVQKNQNVATGEVIGYSGSTGYATGPHLHFGVYISEAVQLMRLGEWKTKTSCANAIIPVAPLNAYLDPLEYL